MKSLFIAALMICSCVIAQEIEPMVAKKIVEQAKQNQNWKVAFATGKQEQIVFMSISPKTNPKNEIGVEVHEFDQLILIVEGTGKAILKGKETHVQAGDLIFIPLGVEHNVINTGTELKLISFYALTDIPAGSIYPTKSEQIED